MKALNGLQEKGKEGKRFKDSGRATGSSVCWERMILLIYRA